jgi:UDP-N-acetylglucosamine 1-carboxyvinyltransferase
VSAPAGLTPPTAGGGRPLGGGTILVEGGYPLRGTVPVGGSKNSALPILAACLLTDEPCTISNLPDIEDIYTMLAVLRALGAEVERHDRHTVTVTARNLMAAEVPPELGTRMRASFLAVGPLLARLGRALAPHPGGCDIGMRPVNVDVRGFQAMGARVVQEPDPRGGGDGARGAERKVRYAIEAPRLRGARLYLDYPSHTGTENLLLAACCAEGTTVIRHASMEPEVSDLATFLGSMGARIEGIGSSTLVIEGVPSLHGATHRIIPDRLAAGTYLLAGVMVKGGEVRVVDVVPEHLEPVTYKLQESGARVEEGRDWVSAGRDGSLEGVDLQAIHYPGFPTDLQAAFAALLSQAHGRSVIHERVFENRLEYAAELRNMGAGIEVDASGQRATISGPRELHGEPLIYARDIRSGAAVVLAALAAKGKTVIIHAYHLDRGYEDLVSTLASLGARIRRLNSAEAAEELLRAPDWSAG